MELKITTCFAFSGRQRCSRQKVNSVLALVHEWHTYITSPDLNFVLDGLVLFSEWLEMKSVNSLRRTLQQCIRKVSNFLFKRSVCLITNTQRRLKNDRNPTLGVRFRGGGRVFVLQNCLSTEGWLNRIGYTLLFIAFHSLWMLIVPRTFRARWQQERRNWGKSKDRQKKLKAIWGKLLSKSLKWGFVLFCSILCPHWWL